MFVSAAAAAPANEGTASESTTSTFKRKRSGPVSSLDYKLPLSVDKKKYVIPPRRGKKAGQQQQQQQQQQQEQSESGDPHHRTRSTPETRARTGTGIPDSATTHRLTMEDLAGMGVQLDNEQRRPDTDNAEQPPNNSHKRQEKFYRTPDGTVVKEGVDRLEILKDQGFPFVQWIILLLLLGFGLYSLYKSLSGPTTARAKKGIDSGGSINNHHKQVPGKSSKFGKSRKAPPSRSSVNASNKQKKKGENTSMIANTSRTTSIEDEKVLAEIDETVVAKPQQSAAASKKATPKKKSAAKQQQQGKKTANSTTSKTTKPEPTTELMGTDESSVFVTTAGRQPLTTHRSDVAVADEPVSGVGDDEDGWQTVGGSAGRLAEVSAITGSGSNDETGKPETKKVKSKTKKNKSISSVPVMELVESVAVTAVEDDVVADTPIVESSTTVVDTSPVMESVFSTTLEPNVEQEEVVSALGSLQDEPTTTNMMSKQDGEIKTVDDKDLHKMNGSSPDSIEDMEVEEDAVAAAATATPKKKIKKKKKTKQNGAALLSVGANMTTVDHDDMKDAVELATTTADMTDSDEAFALQLQEEEHKLAAAADDTIIPEPDHDVSSHEIVWEEVKTKKKKAQPQPTSKTESQPADTTVAEVAAAAE